MEACLPGAVHLGWGPQCEARSPQFTGTSEAVASLLPYVFQCQECGAWPDCISVPPTYLNVAFAFYLLVVENLFC